MLEFYILRLVVAVCHDLVVVANLLRSLKEQAHGKRTACASSLVSFLFLCCCCRKRCTTGLVLCGLGWFFGLGCFAGFG